MFCTCNVSLGLWACVRVGTCVCVQTFVAPETVAVHHQNIDTCSERPAATMLRVKFIILYTFTRNRMAYAVRRLESIVNFAVWPNSGVKRFTILCNAIHSIQSNCPPTTRYSIQRLFFFCFFPRVSHGSSWGYFRNSLIVCIVLCVCVYWTAHSANAKYKQIEKENGGCNEPLI